MNSLMNHSIYPNGLSKLVVGGNIQKHSCKQRFSRLGLHAGVYYFKKSMKSGKKMSVNQINKYLLYPSTAGPIRAEM